MNSIVQSGKELEKLNKKINTLPALKNIEEVKKGRKAESKFVTAVLSRIGERDSNQEYSGYIELDDFSCWVVSNGLRSSKAAKIVVEEIIGEFIKQPKLSRRYMKHLIKTAEAKIVSLQEKSRENKGMGASVTIILSNYSFLIMGNVGNTRGLLVRDGIIYNKTVDDSMAYLFYAAEKLTYDEIRFHGLRDELSQYIGDYKKVRANISPKIKFEEGDKLLLLSKGAWENLDESDIEITLSQSTGVGKWIGLLEKKIKDNTRGKLDNYTMIGVYINQIAIVKKNYKSLYAKFGIIVTLLSAVLLIGYKGYSIKEKTNVRYKEIKLNEKLSIEKLSLDEFIASIDLLNENIKLYEGLELKLKDSTNFEKIVLTPEILSDNYKEQIKYIKLKISDIEKLKLTKELLKLGDLDYRKNNFSKSKTNYETSLEELNKIGKIDYVGIEGIKSELNEKILNSEILELGDDLKKQGDKFVKENNIPAAIRTYLEAKLIFMKYSKIDLMSEVNMKVELLTKEREKKYQKAEIYERRGIKSEAIDIDEAILHYQMAKKLYLDLGEESRRDEVSIKISNLEELRATLKERNKRYYGDARLYIENQEYDKAVELLKSAKKAAEKLKNDQLVTNALEKEGDLLLGSEKYEESLTSYKEALNTSRNTKSVYQQETITNKIEMLEILLEGIKLEKIGDELYFNKSYKEAKEKYIETKVIYESLNSNKYYPTEKYDTLILTIDQKEKSAWQKSNWIPFF